MAMNDELDYFKANIDYYSALSMKLPVGSPERAQLYEAFNTTIATHDAEAKAKLLETVGLGNGVYRHEDSCAVSDDLGCDCWVWRVLNERAQFLVAINRIYPETEVKRG